MTEEREIKICAICKGEGELEGDGHIENCGWCHGSGEVEVIEQWEEEFEDEIFDNGIYDGGIQLKRWMNEDESFFNFNDLIQEYFGESNWSKTIKVKIKARKGKIVIEEIN